MAVQTSLMRDGNAATLLDMLIKSKIDFDLYASNYTMQIVIDGQRTKYIRSQQSNQVFAAYRKIQADIKNNKVKNVQAEEVQY